MICGTEFVDKVAQVGKGMILCRAFGGSNTHHWIGNNISDFQ